jgi:hypothetical protein
VVGVQEDVASIARLVDEKRWPWRTAVDGVDYDARRILFFDDQSEPRQCAQASQYWFCTVYKILDSQLQPHPVQHDATFLSMLLFEFISVSDDY